LHSGSGAKETVSEGRTPGGMSASQPPPDAERGLSVERRAERIANARSVTFGLAATFFVLALLGALLMRVVAPHSFPTIGSATWWALQRVTTVGYGDAVPTTTGGKLVAGIEMVIGVSLISLLTAAVTSTVIRRGETAANEEERLREERIAQTILAALDGLDDRLSRIESEVRKT
jgi:voltage-gated potassium channel Kch